MPDYSIIDRPLYLTVFFYPRRDCTPCPQDAFDLYVPTGEDVYISCRFYAYNQAWPWILFFHGNGEVVSDYDAIAPLYGLKKINLVVADYRGYGASSGTPAFTHMVNDAGCLLKAAKEELSKKGFGPDLWVMGRSLGSVSALELAHRYPQEIRGLIIESGFTCLPRRIIQKGLPSTGPNLQKLERECLDNIKAVSIPALIIHGESDSIVPLQEAKDLFNCLGSSQKELIIIPDADHNDIMLLGFEQYFEVIRKFINITINASK